MELNKQQLKLINMLQTKSNFILDELNNLLDLRTKLLKKDNLTDYENKQIEVLNNFCDNLPLSLDSTINDGFSLIREFAKKIGENAIKE